MTTAEIVLTALVLCAVFVLGAIYGDMP
jgi:hypothetical protein